MPAKTILTALFLISLGSVVVVFLHALPQPLSADPVAAKDQVLVATTTLSSGTLLRLKDVAWQPTTAAEPGQIRRPSTSVNNASAELEQNVRDEVYGAALRADVAAGEPIRRGTIVKPGDRDFLQVVLSPGARAIAIPVSTGGASTGLLYPGDRVDVILTQSFKDESPLTRRSVSETVVKNLRVLAVDAADVKSTSPSNGFGRTVTLEVTPEQAEKINVATELGKLSLTLRSRSAAAAVDVGYSPGSANTTAVRPTWAGDVSPALVDATLPRQAITAERPAIEVIHGTKSVAVTPQGQSAAAAARTVRQ
jgi:pilus assembly protein CpaB